MGGKDFRKLLDGFSIADSLKDNLKHLTSNLNEYKAKYISELKKIRNSCVAHREKNSIEHLRIISTLNWSDSVESLTGFDKILMKYGEFMQEVINTSLKESDELRKLKSK